jgi:hypothetical protein
VTRYSVTRFITSRSVAILRFAPVASLPIPSTRIRKQSCLPKYVYLLHIRTMSLISVIRRNQRTETTTTTPTTPEAPYYMTAGQIEWVREKYRLGYVRVNFRKSYKNKRDRVYNKRDTLDSAIDTMVESFEIDGILIDSNKSAICILVRRSGLAVVGELPQSVNGITDWSKVPWLAFTDEYVVETSPADEKGIILLTGRHRWAAALKYWADLENEINTLKNKIDDLQRDEEAGAKEKKGQGTRASELESLRERLANREERLALIEGWPAELVDLGASTIY